MNKHQLRNCTKCHGTGNGYYPGVPCDHCGGTKVEPMFGGPRHCANGGTGLSMPVRGGTIDPASVRLDTSNLGHIPIDNCRAAMVREALDRAAKTLWDRGASNRAAIVVQAFRTVIRDADNETLAYIDRLLR